MQSLEPKTFNVLTFDLALREKLHGPKKKINVAVGCLFNIVPGLKVQQRHPRGCLYGRLFASRRRADHHLLEAQIAWELNTGPKVDAVGQWQRLHAYVILCQRSLQTRLYQRLQAAAPVNIYDCVNQRFGSILPRQTFF